MSCSAARHAGRSVARALDHAYRQGPCRSRLRKFVELTKSLKGIISMKFQSDLALDDFDQSSIPINNKGPAFNRSWHKWTTDSKLSDHNAGRV
jgi:hypothetical protein